MVLKCPASEGAAIWTIESSHAAHVLGRGRDRRVGPLDRKHRTPLAADAVTSIADGDKRGHHMNIELVVTMMIM